MSKRVKGSVSVLLCLVLLPMITYSTMIIDASRLQVVRSNIAGAGEITLNAMMSDYNTMLEEMFGLFANTSLMDEKDPDKKNENVARALEAYFQQTIESKFLPEVGRHNEYVQNTINGLVDKGMRATTKIDDEDLTDFLALQLQTFSADPVTGAALANPNTLKRQIMEYMKYRGPVSIASTLLGKLDYLKDSSSQVEACDNKIEYTKKLGELQEPCLEAYDAIEKEYNLGAMMINELVGKGILEPVNEKDHLKDLIDDSKKQYERMTAFYMLDAQSPFYKTGYRTGNFYDYGSLGYEYLDKSSDISAAEKTAIGNDYKDVVDTTKHPDLNSDDFDTRCKARIEALEALITAAKDTKLYSNYSGADQKYNQGYDVVRSRIEKSTTRPINNDNGADAKLSIYHGVGGEKIEADGVKKSQKYLNWFKIQSDSSDLFKLFNDLPAVSDPANADTLYENQLKRAKDILALQRDIEDGKDDVYKKQIAEYSCNHKRLQAISTQMNKIWDALEKDMIKQFLKEKKDRIQEIEDHNKVVTENILKYNAEYETYNKYSHPDYRKEQETEYNTAVTNWSNDMAEWEKGGKKGDPPAQPVLHDPPVLQSPSDYWKFEYGTEWQKFCEEHNYSGRLTTVDMHHAAIDQIVGAMNDYSNRVNVFLTKAAHKNEDYFLKYARHYNEEGYSGIAGVGMTLETMKDGLSTANKKMDKILSIVTGDLKTKQEAWEKSINGDKETNTKGINSDSTKAAMLNDYDTLTKQFSEQEVRDLKMVIVGEDGKGNKDGTGGLLSQVQKMLDAIQGIKYLDQTLFKLQPISGTFSDAMQDEIENKIKEKFGWENKKLIDFFNVGKSPILQDFNKKAWDKICGDSDIPVFPSFERDSKETEPVATFAKTSVFKSDGTIDEDSIKKAAAELVKAKYDDSSLYDSSKSAYIDAISHFRVLDGILDSVGCAYSKEDQDKINLVDLKDRKSSVLDPQEAFMVTLYTEAKAAEKAAAHEEEKKTSGDKPEDNLKKASDKTIENSKEKSEDKRDKAKLASEDFKKIMENIEKYCDQNKKNEVKDPPTIESADTSKKDDGGGLKAAKELLASIATIGEKIVENVYLEEYFTEMFTCRTDNQMLNSLTKDADKHVLPVIMLNGYHNQAAVKGKETDKQLLNENTEWYGKEIEYLLWGSSDLDKNLAYTDATIFAVRFALNAIYAFTAPDIQSYALELATAIAGWTVVGVPIVQVCITILIALAESGYDLYLLHDGRDVPIYKNQTTFACSPTGMLKTIATEAFQQISEEVIKKVADKVESSLDNAIESLGDKVATAGEERIKALGETVTNFKNQQTDAIKTAIQKQFVTPFMNEIIPLGSLIDIGQMYAYADPKEMINDAVEKALTAIEGNINGMQGGIVQTICQRLWKDQKENIKNKATEVIFNYFDSIYDLDNNPSTNATELNIEDQMKEYLDKIMEPFSSEIDKEVKTVTDKLSKELKEATDITVTNAKAAIHEKMDAAKQELTGKVEDASGKILEQIPAGDASKIDTDANSGVTLNYKEYCKIFMMLFVSLNQDAMLQRCAVLITVNMRNAVEKKAGSADPVDRGQHDFVITNANTLFSVNAQVKMMTLFPWPAKDVLDDTSAENGLQLDLNNLRSSTMTINYCGVNGY